MKELMTEYRSLGSTGEMLGIVLMENEVGEITCRMGLVIGNPESSQIQRIMLQGGKLLRNEAIVFFPIFGNEIINRWKKD